MDSGQDIISAETELRDLIRTLLLARYGADWLEQSGLTDLRLAKVYERRQVERVRRDGVVIDDDLTAYLDLTDLPVIILKQWETFQPVFGDRKAFEVYMKRLDEFRTAQMHSRQLAPFERALVAGITGEIRQKVTMYRSERGPDREYFPRIEEVRDSFGYVTRIAKVTSTGLIIRPGDAITFDCRAWDPAGAPCEWTALLPRGSPVVRFESPLVWDVIEDDVSDPAMVIIFLTSTRRYHRKGKYDDWARFTYRVLPGD